MNPLTEFINFKLWTKKHIIPMKIIYIQKLKKLQSQIII